MRDLTPRQREAHGFIAQFITDTGKTPTYAVLRKRFNIRRDNLVHKLLIALEKKGFIRRPTPKHPRAGAPIQILRAAA